LLKPVDQNADASKALFPAIVGDVHQFGLFIKREMLLEGVEHSMEHLYVPRQIISVARKMYDFV